MKAKRATTVLTADGGVIGATTETPPDEPLKKWAVAVCIHTRINLPWQHWR